MSYESRKVAIMNELSMCGKLSFAEIEKILDASATTIRRDLSRMAEEGLVTRFHGGVKLENGVSEFSMNQKMNMNADDKRHIARVAASYLKPNELIFIGGGTSTYSMIDYITETSISAITNSVPHAEALHRRGILTFLLCGFLRERTRSLGGNETVELMKRYHYDRCFMSANGISTSLDLLSADHNEFDIKETAIANSERSYVLADASKFGPTAMYATKIDAYPNILLITNNEKCRDSAYVHYVE